MEVDEAARKEAWLAERRKHITGTDVAAILGISPWRTDMQVWLDKKHLVEQEDSEQLRWGRRLERAILEGYSEGIGQTLDLFEYHLMVATCQPILAASLDARWKNPDHRPVDAKNIRRKNEEWGVEGTGDVPPYYAVQLAAQMLVTDTAVADLAVLFSGNRLECFSIYRDRELDEIILDKVGEWWERHIVQDTPPPMDGSKRTTDYLAKRFAKQTELIIPAKPETVAIAQRAALVSAIGKRFQEEEDRLKNMLRNEIGEAQGIEGVCTWRMTNPKPKLDTDAYIADLEKAVRDMLMVGHGHPGLGDATIDELRAKHTHPVEGSRVLRITYKEEPDE